MELKGTLFLVMRGENWIIQSKVQGLLLLQGLIPRDAVYPIVCALCSLWSCLYEQGFHAGALHASDKAGAFWGGSMCPATEQPWKLMKRRSGEH